MKPVAKEVIEVTSTLDGDVFRMGIDPNSLAHVMEVLTNLYSDEELAVLREYSTNGLDAHIDAGQARPIEVSLPTHLKQTLVIRDWGEGLDRNDFEKIYSQYGLSTKTETNEQTGFLGLGCKSGLAYTHTFTVTGIKALRDYSGDREFAGGGAGRVCNVKTVASVSKNDEGIGQMTVVHEEMTEEPSGVTITIPTRAYHNFEQKAAYLFKFWPEGSVLVNGETPERFEGLRVSDRITLMSGMRDKGGYPAPNYVIMGNVPYPVDDSQFDFGLPSGYTIVGKVPNGTMHIAPNREALRYTKATHATLQQLSEQFNSDLLDSINKEIEAAPTRHDALKIVLKWRSSLPRSMKGVTFKYRNLSLPTEIVVPGGEMQTFTVAEGKPQTDYYGKNYKVGYHQRMRAIDITMVPDAIWVYGFERTFTPTVKKKLWMHLEMESRDFPNTFVLAKEKISSPWINPENVIDWAPIEELKLPRISSQSGRNMTGRRPSSYDVYVVQGNKSDWERDVLHDEIDPGLPIYYVEGDNGTAGYRATALAQIEDEFQVVPLTANRIAKFQRLFPTARQINTVMKEYANYWFTTLSSLDRDLLQMQHARSDMRALDALPAYGILDPKIKRAKRLKQYDAKYIEYLNETYRYFSRYGDWELGRWENPLKRYPLMQTDSYYANGIPFKRLRKHNLIYVNAVYTELYQEN